MLEIRLLAKTAQVLSPQTKGTPVLLVTLLLLSWVLILSSSLLLLSLRLLRIRFLQSWESLKRSFQLKRPSIPDGPSGGGS
jgi:hypothetical protein